MNNKWKNFIVQPIIIFLGITAIAFLWQKIFLFQKFLEDFFYAQIAKPLENLVLIQLPPKKPPLQINARAVFSVKINPFGKEKILFQKNENEILPIASLTKLMTALLVVIHPQEYDLKKEIIISPNASLQEDVPEFGNLQPYERKKIKDLLILMLKFSSNDAAVALAEVLGEEIFIEKMNQKAKDLSLENTHFSNPTGLDPENISWNLENKEHFNYSTAKDLFSLSKYILREFPFIFEFSNHKKQITLSDGQKIIGIKTGYTPTAGGCLLLIFADQKGNYFFNVILGAKGKEERFEEMQKLINWINS